MCSCNSCNSRCGNAPAIEFTTINPCQYFSRLGTSVSRWCSNGNNGMQCGGDVHHHHHHCESEHCFAHLVHDGELCIGPGYPVPFTGRAIFHGDCFLPDNDCGCGCNCGCNSCGCDRDDLTRDDYFVDDGVLQLAGPRIYRVEYSLHIPQDADVQTELQLQLDGEVIPGSHRVINHTPGQGCQTIHVDVVFETCADVSLLSLVSTSNLCFTPAMDGEAAASMTITTIG